MTRAERSKKELQEMRQLREAKEREYRKKKIKSIFSLKEQCNELKTDYDDLSFSINKKFVSIKNSVKKNLRSIKGSTGSIDEEIKVRKKNEELRLQRIIERSKQREEKFRKEIQSTDIINTQGYTQRNLGKSKITENFLEYSELTLLIDKKYSLAVSKGGYYTTENLNTATNIAADIVKKTNLFSKVESIEAYYESFAQAHHVPILYSGSIEEIKESLIKYCQPAKRERYFKHFQIKCPKSDTYAIDASCQFGIVYQTHIDPIYINKTEKQEYFIFGILPPYSENLRPYKQYMEWIPRKIYESE